MLHPTLVAAVRAGAAPATLLERYDRARRPAIQAVMRFQVRQSRAMLSTGGLAARIRPVAARLIAHTPLARKITHRVAYGSTAVDVATELFAGSTDAHR